MHYTREPIIETVVTPREGHKLVVRSSRGASQEEYWVEALEVVSFGTALFFRSIERPKSFLLPVGDYEVVEVRETRLVVKHAALPEKGSRQPTRSDASDDESKSEKKSRRRTRRRRGGESKEAPSKEEAGSEVSPEAEVEREERPVEPLSENAFDEVSPIASLLPPPAELISDTIERYREMANAGDLLDEDEEVSSEGIVLPDPLPEASEEEDEEDIPSGFSASALLKRLTGRDSFSPLPPSEGDEE